ncbi:MAG TPA: GTP-binding protein [Planctomycetota bacterium]|nr:GTP-binding protein [Planctomycetota bacterium]
MLLVQLAGRLRRALESLVDAPACEETLRRVEALRATCDYGRRLVEPATVVITGAPNVGKSTLANALAGRERSIVHHLPGTTRDAVTSVASVDGFPVVVVDTAGLREAADEIERIGMTKTLEHAGSCDLVLWVFDHSRDVTREEAAWLDVLGELPLVPVMNKIDLDGPATAREIGELTREEVQRVCALTGRGVEPLRGRIVGALVGTPLPARDAAVVTTRRVRNALDEAVSKHDRSAADGTVFDRDILE